MQTRLIFTDSKKNLEINIKHFIEEYRNIEDLFQDIQRNRCTDPDKVDDYMVWHTINSVDKDTESARSHGEVDENKDLVRDHPQILFHEEIILHTTEFYQVLTPRRMELLEFININNPTSVKTLAEATGRDYKNVYDDVLALQKFCLLDLVREGKNKRPVSRLGAIEVLFRK